MERIRTTPGEPPLDRILRTRSHLRVLRALAVHDGRDNLTARDLARRAGVAHASAMRVLPELVATGIVEKRTVRDYGLYDLRSEHVLASALAGLFDDELHVDQSILAFVRREARAGGRVVSARLWRSDGGEVFLTLNGRGLANFAGRLWVDRLDEEIAARFGEAADIEIEARTPSALRGLMD